MAYHQIPSVELPEQEPFLGNGEVEPSVRKKSVFFKNLGRIMLSLSILANMILLTVLIFQVKPTEKVFDRSEFAGLTRTIPKQWPLNQAGNDTEWSDLWDQHTSYDPGVIALDDDYARSMGLPRAQRWPWDSGKGIYLLNAYHNLHCVKNIRSSLEEFRSSSPQSVPWEHVQHCLLVLRDEIMCNADDTPRYSGFQPEHSSGLGQVRMCRDWGAFERWAMSPERSGCWKHIPGERGVHGFRVLDRYRFCPPGSPYEEQAKTTWLDHEAQDLRFKQ